VNGVRPVSFPLPFQGGRRKEAYNHFFFLLLLSFRKREEKCRDRGSLLTKRRASLLSSAHGGRKKKEIDALSSTHILSRDRKKRLKGSINTLGRRKRKGDLLHELSFPLEGKGEKLTGIHNNCSGPMHKKKKKGGRGPPSVPLIGEKKKLNRIYIAPIEREGKISSGGGRRFASCYQKEKKQNEYSPRIGKGERRPVPRAATRFLL